MRVFLPGLLWLLSPGVAHACAVCFSATENNRWSFIWTTALLTFLPLIMIGSVAFYVYRRVKEIEALEQGV